MAAHARWVMPADVVVAPVGEFDPETRARLPAGTDDHVVGRPRSRGRSVVVDAAGLALVRQFRTPTAVADAILRHCRESGTRWQDEVGDALGLLECFRQAQLLVPYRTPRDVARRRTLAPGATVGRFTVGACVHEFGDVQVYRAARNDTPFALKILDRRPLPRSVQMLRREALVLQHLRGRDAPYLVDAGVHRGRPYLVESWCAGATALAAGHALRAPAGLPASTKLHQVCLAILRAYQSLHALSALHGDVHAKNVLVKPDGGVCLVDFGLASWPGVLSSLPDPPGDAHPRYVSPEAAVAMLADRPPPPATPWSEQYALAALCFHLLTGGHHLAFGLRKTDWLREIAEAPTLPFSAHGEESWPELESVLRRALAKQPQDRFPSVGALADAFEAACAPAAGSAPHGARSRSTAQHHLDATIQRLRFDGGSLPAGIAVAPTCSVNYGAAGVAYFFYRLACLRESAELLHSANAWARWAERHLADPDASHCDAIHITRRATGPISLYHMASGVHYVQALVSLVLGDGAGVRRHVEGFVAAARTACGNLDVTLGRGGILIACANLLGALPASQRVAREHVARLGATITGALVTGIDAAGGRRRPIASLGIAHGRAGLAYALLRWHEVDPIALEPVARALDDLARRVTIDRRGASWPMRIGRRPGDRSRWVSWCNGSAGQVYLWTLAHRILGGDRYRALAEQSAAYVWNVACERPRDAASLCCGYAGQAYALLSLHRATGEGVWHDRARHLSERAAAVGCVSHRESLFKGDVGVALLAEEVARPEAARMPVFEDEGWDGRGR